MRDRILILAGLSAFLVLITMPIWWDAASGTTSKGPEPVLPATEKACVAPEASAAVMLVDARKISIMTTGRFLSRFSGIPAGMV